MVQSVRDRFPLKVTINGEDYTFLLSENFTFSNVDPGGYELASFSFGKDLPNVLRGQNVRIDCGTQVAWEGRVKEIQRSLGAKTLIQCEGYGARLKDETLSMVFVDRDLTRWTAPGVERVKIIVKPVSEEAGAFANALGSIQVGVASTGQEPALILAFTGSWATTGVPIAEAWYDAGPENTVEEVYIHMVGNEQAQKLQGENLCTALVFQAGTYANPAFSTSNLGVVGVAAYYSPYRTEHMRYYGLDFKAKSSGGTANSEYMTFWTQVAIYGNSGLTKRGSAPAGFYASDIAEWVAKNVPGIKAGVIPEASFYTVPHAAYYTPVEAQQMVADMAKLLGYHWGVWESLTYLTGNEEPRLDFRPYPGNGESTAWCWRKACETLDVREDLSSQYNHAQVTFTDAGGSEQAVKATVANPVLEKAGITGRTIALTLGTSTEAAAKAYGELSLRLLQEQARVVGSAEILEPISRVSGGEMAPWMLKSGIDRLRVPDLPSFDAWGQYNELPITRVECSGGADGIKTAVEFGQGRNLLEAITAELNQAAVLGGQGG